MTSSAPFSFVRTVAAISGVYDAAVGIALLLAADQFATLFGVAPAQPRIFSDLNGLFLIAVGIGYYWPYRDPRGARWYLWVMGPGLKGAGAVAFLADYLVRHSHASFLLFAASDGGLAILTLVALLGVDGGDGGNGTRSTRRNGHTEERRLNKSR